jgi:succinate dehydrogenase / fumarate reductase cytochrome b subunit
LGDNGKGFIDGVNSIHSLPYLPFIEIFLLGVPFAIHAVWGLHYLFTSKANSFSGDGSKPDLSEYPRNHAYTWQRITSWILLVGIIAHVVHMRFLEYPASADRLGERYYMSRLSLDDGLYTLASRLSVSLYGEEEILREKNHLKALENQDGLSNSMPPSYLFDLPKANDLLWKQQVEQQKNWVAALEENPLNKGEIIAVSNSFGTAELLMVRDAFKSFWIQILYTIFVLSAAFHAFNGLWTFLVTWGIILTVTSQWWMQRISWGLMILTSFFGLAAIWATYFLNLKT